MRLLHVFCAGLLMTGCGLSFNPDLPSSSQDGGEMTGDGQPPVGDGDGVDNGDGDGDGDGDGSGGNTAMGGLGGQGGAGPEEVR